MEIVKLQAATKDYIWGGKKLRGWGFGSEKDEKIAEAWALSFHPDGPSRIAGTDVKLCDAATRADWGEACDGFPFFPVLIKFIDSADNLSVQVHPSDEYALAREGEFGKTEMWYVVDCEPGAGLYVGLKRALSREELAAYAQAGTVLDAMNFFPVEKGESYFIAAGTLHAIGKGCTVAEVQQNSNLTYRVYDYGRRGSDGKPRALHLKKALDVTNLNAYEPVLPAREGLLADCKYFTAAKTGSSPIGRKDSFTGLVALADGGTVDGKPVRRGDTYFIPAGKTARTENADLLAVWVEER